MSINLKTLALASAAFLALPAASYASASLDLVENNITDWTLAGNGFSTFELNASSVTLSTGAFATSFTPVTSVSFTGTWTDTTDTSANNANGKEFVVTDNAPNTVVAELNGAVSFNGAIGTFSGTLYLGESGFGDSNPVGGGVTNVASIMMQGGVETIPFAADNSTITIDTSAVPEPASLALLGTGLLGLGTTIRRRRRKSDR